MTLQVLLARPLMRLARTLTPTSRAEWAAAMHEEFTALEGSRGAVAWAAGCLGVAIRWRVAAEAPLASALLGISFLGSLISTRIFFLLVDWASSRDLSWMPFMTAAQALMLASLCFVLAIVWPRRAWLVGLFLPLAWGFGSLPLFLAGSFGAVLGDPLALTSASGALPPLPAILMPMLLMVQEIAPGLIGAALGAGFARARQAGGR